MVSGSTSSDCKLKRMMIDREWLIVIPDRKPLQTEWQLLDAEASISLQLRARRLVRKSLHTDQAGAGDCALTASIGSRARRDPEEDNMCECSVAPVRMYAHMRACLRWRQPVKTRAIDVEPECPLHLPSTGSGLAFVQRLNITAVSLPYSP